MKHTKFITLTVGMFFALSSFGNTSEDPLKIVQKSILEDPLMEQVSRMAHHTVSTVLMLGMDTVKYGYVISTLLYK